jgi:hypothetical protein
MELLYQIRRGFNPNILDRLSGIQDDATIVTVSLCLTEKSSKRLLPSVDLARVFGLILHKLAKERPINLLFPYDDRKVQRNLKKINVQVGKEKRNLWVEIAPPHIPTLVKVLEAGAFTTFYGCVDGELGKQITGRDEENGPDLLFKRAGQSYFLTAFSLFDEGLEIISKYLSAESVINTVQTVAAEEGIQVCCTSAD